MTKPDDSVYLQHILEAIQQIETYLHDVSYEIFRQNRMIQDAVVRQLEIVGEASRNLTETFQARHQEIPWSEIIGMRHKIAHNYFEVDLGIVWDTVKTDLPPVKEQISRLVGKA